MDILHFVLPCRWFTGARASLLYNTKDSVMSDDIAQKWNDVRFNVGNR